MDEFITTSIARDTQFIMNLPDELKKSITEYTYASTEVNTTLRTRISRGQKYDTIIRNIDAIFRMVDPIKSQLLLYRGIDNEGHAHTDNAFISATYSLDASRNFSDPDCCICVINVSAGSKLLFLENIAQNSNEREVLIDRGGTFAVTAVNRQTIPRQIHLTYLPPSSVVSHSLAQVVTAVDQTTIVNSIITRNPKSAIEDYIELGIDPYHTINADYKSFTGTDISRELAQNIIHIILNS